MATPLTAPRPVSFEDGPALSDSGALLAWLEATKGRLVQLPVVLQFDDEHRLAITAASVAGLALKLDDTSMGIALLDQVRGVCPPGSSCPVWLEGTWGPLIAGLPDFDTGPSKHDFAVRRVVGLAEAATRARGERR